MPVSAATIRLLVEAGVTGETLVRIVDSIDADNQADISADIIRRQRHAESQARYALRRRAADISTDQRGDPPRVRVVVSSSSTEIPGKKRKKERPTEAELRTELETVLDPEHAAAVVEHRERKKPFNTLQGARALASKFAKCPDPNAAADTMLANDWIGIEASWLEPRRPNGTGPPPKPPTMSAKMVELLKKPLGEIYDRSRSEEPPRPPLRAIRDG